MKTYWYSVMVNGDSQYETTWLKEARDDAHAWRIDYDLDDDEVEIWLMSIEPGGTPKYELTALM